MATKTVLQLSCDRCPKTGYAPVGTTFDRFPFYGFSTLILNYVQPVKKEEDRKLTRNELMLCPDCLKAFKEFMA